MPTRFPDGFDPQAVKAMMDAFDKACESLGLVDRHDPIIENLRRERCDASRP
jgi:hypothetical protein